MKENFTPEMRFRNAARYSPKFFLLFGILAYLVTGNFLFLRVFVYVFITEIFIYSFKQLFGNLDQDWVYRPENKYCGTCLNCKITSNEKQLGMPSGHTAVAFMFSTFFIAKIWRSDSFFLSKILRTVFLALIAIGIGISRTSLFENCHTVPQVVAGAIFGMILGLFFFWVENINL